MAQAAEVMKPGARTILPAFRHAAPGTTQQTVSAAAFGSAFRIVDASRQDQPSAVVDAAVLVMAAIHFSVGDDPARAFDFRAVEDRLRSDETRALLARSKLDSAKGSSSSGPL